MAGEKWIFAVEGVAVGGVFERDIATGAMPLRTEEVRPMNAVSTVGVPLQSTITRLR